MELRQYWNVIWKRRWLVLAVLGLTALVSGAMFLLAKPTYEAEVRFMTRQEMTPPQPDATAYDLGYSWYYRWFSSEFLVDDYTQIVPSDAFATAVHNLVKNDISLGREKDAYTIDDIKAALEVDRRHRELRVGVTAPSRAEAVAISQAVARVLGENLMRPISGAPIDDRSMFAQIDEATPDEVKSSSRSDLLNAVIRVVVGLAAALALVFLLEYLDVSVRDERDVRRTLEMPVIGAIPRT